MRPAYRCRAQGARAHGALRSGLRFQAPLRTGADMTGAPDLSAGHYTSVCLALNASTGHSDALRCGRAPEWRGSIRLRRAPLRHARIQTRSAAPDVSVGRAEHPAVRTHCRSVPRDGPSPVSLPWAPKPPATPWMVCAGRTAPGGSLRLCHGALGWSPDASAPWMVLWMRPRRSRMVLWMRPRP